GTFTATNAGNMLTTAIGTVLTLNGMTIGAGGLSFASCVSTSGQVAIITNCTGTITLGQISTSSGTATALSLTSAGTVNLGSTTASSLTTSSAACVVLNATTLNLTGTGVGAGLSVTTTSGGTGVSVTGGTVDITGGGLVITNSGGGSGYVATTAGTTVTVQG